VNILTETKSLKKTQQQLSLNLPSIRHLRTLHAI
jgi:hypothetical protein